MQRTLVILSQFSPRIRHLRLPVRRPKQLPKPIWNLVLGLRVRLVGFPSVVDPESDLVMPKAGKNSFYAVKVGKKTGIFKSWPEAEKQVKGFPGAKFKSFRTESDALDFLGPTSSTDTNSIPIPPIASSSSSSTKSPHNGNLGSSGAGRATSPPSITPPTSLPPDLKKLAEKGYSFHLPTSSKSQSESGSSKGYKLVVYCDGSGINNGKIGARAGAGVFWGSGGEALTRNIAERVPGTLQTNNRGELLAIILALEQCPLPDLPLEMRTDSQYTIQCMTTFLPKWIRTNFHTAPVQRTSASSGPKWKLQGKSTEVKNQDLIKHLLVLLRRRGPANGVRFKYVRGHAGERGNEEADRLARMGAWKEEIADREKWLTPEDAEDTPGKTGVDIEIDESWLMSPEELEALEKDFAEEERER